MHVVHVLAVCSLRLCQQRLAQAVRSSRLFGVLHFVDLLRLYAKGLCSLPKGFLLRTLRHSLGNTFLKVTG